MCYNKDSSFTKKNILYRSYLDFYKLFINPFLFLSRRDDTLLIVDVNLRTGADRNHPQVPQGRYDIEIRCRPCGT
jgi:hypothetical protein